MKIYLTFDYELFLGKNYETPEKVLVEPTNKIIKILGEKNVKATFFVDVFSSIQHKKYGLCDYSKLFEEQIQSLIKMGHDVQLHIHPHWVMSEYVNGEWKHKREYYSLKSFENGVIDPFGKRQTIDTLISEGKSYLESVCREVLPDYKCIAFRAGGFALQPFNIAIPALLKQGIVIDSSIGVSTIDYNQYRNYNYLMVPSDCNFSIFGDGTISKTLEKGASMYEIPICSKRNSFFSYIFRRKKHVLPSNKPLKGEPIDLTSGNASNKNPWFRRLLVYRKTGKMLSLDGLRYDFLVKVVEEKKEHYRDIALIGHPKFFDDNRINNMSSFIDCALKKKIIFATMVEKVNSDEI